MNKIIYIPSISTIPSQAANTIHVIKMCHAFAKNGKEISLFVPNKLHFKKKSLYKIYNYYGVKNNFEIILIPWIKIRGWEYIFSILSALNANIKKPDIVISRNIYGCYFSMLLGMKVALELHSPVDTKYKNIFSKIIINKNLKSVIVITKSLKEHILSNYNGLNDKIIVEPDAAEPIPDYTEPVKLESNNYSMQVGYVGHLYKGKGMEIIYKLAQICPWAYFNIVGGRNKEIYYWKHKCNKINNIRFHGYIPHYKTVNYIMAFDVLLLPNQKEVKLPKGIDIGPWTSPLKAFEYMAAGKPIISSDLPVLREIFNHKENAILCDHDNPKQWYKALLSLKSNIKLRNKLGNQAKIDFNRYYTWQSRAKRLGNKLL